MYKVLGYETDRYHGGYRVYDDEKGFYEGKVADFDGDCKNSRDKATALAEQLNSKPQLSCRGFGRNGAFGWWRV